MIAPQDESRTFEFTNQYGERWSLPVHLDSCIGELTGDELSSDTVLIRDDQLPADLIFGEDELAWLNECWETAFGRRLRSSVFQRLIEALVGLSKFGRTDPSVGA